MLNPSGAEAVIRSAREEWAITPQLASLRTYGNQPATVAPVTLSHRSATALKARSASRPAHKELNPFC
jgi:hypothetical protein